MQPKNLSLATARETTYVLSFMIPDFNEGNLLPPGVHDATWDEVKRALGFSLKRKKMLPGLLKAARELKGVGVTHLMIDGSFATKKYNPRDFDCCYDDSKIDRTSLHASFNDFDYPRTAMKERFGGELFPSSMTADGLTGEPFSSYFQHTEDHLPKGVINLDLSTLP